MNTSNRDQSVRTARQGAIMMNSAVAGMTRAAAKSNPDRMLRCWRTERVVANCVAAVKGKSQ